jgi:hypothetical protein
MPQLLCKFCVMMRAQIAIKMGIGTLNHRSFLCRIIQIMIICKAEVESDKNIVWRLTGIAGKRTNRQCNLKTICIVADLFHAAIISDSSESIDRNRIDGSSEYLTRQSTNFHCFRPRISKTVGTSLGRGKPQHRDNPSNGQSKQSRQHFRFVWSFAKFLTANLRCSCPTH